MVVPLDGTVSCHLGLVHRLLHYSGGGLQLWGTIMTVATLTLLLKGLDLVMLGIEMSPQIRAAFQDVTKAVQVMLDEGRDPTDAEWAQLDTLRDTVHRQIQEAHHD